MTDTFFRRNWQAGALIALLLVVATISIGTFTFAASAAELANETATLAENETLESIDVTVTANETIAGGNSTTVNVTISNETATVLEDTITVNESESNTTSYAVDDYDELNASVEYTVTVEGADAEVDSVSIEFVNPAEGGGFFESDRNIVFVGALIAVAIFLLASDSGSNGRRRGRH